MGVPRKPSRIQGTQRGQLVPLPGSKSAGLLPRRHGQLPAEVPPPATLSPTEGTARPRPSPARHPDLTPIQPPSLPPHSQTPGFDMRLLRLGLRGHTKMKTDLSSLTAVLDRREADAARRLHKPVSEHLLWRSM